MSKQKRRNICVYCNKRRADTRDHVIPKCLFEKPFPPNLITVPTCSKCNGKKSKDDDYLRDYLTMDFAGSTNDTAQRIFSGKVMRSVARNRSALAKSVLQEGKEEPIHTKGGIYVGHAPTARIDEQRLIRIFDYIVRGLYYDHRKVRVSVRYPVKVSRIMPWDVERAAKDFSKFNLNSRSPLGNVFGCSYACAREDPFSTFWWMRFYDQVFFYVSFINPNAESITGKAA